MRYSVLFFAASSAWLSGCVVDPIVEMIPGGRDALQNALTPAKTEMKAPAAPQATPRLLQKDTRAFCFGLQKSTGGGMQSESEALRLARDARTKGEGRPDYVALFAQNRSLAEAGDAKAGFCLGFMYSQSLGTFKDEGQAARWIGNTAEQGLAEAQYRMAMSVGAEDRQGTAMVDFSSNSNTRWVWDEGWRRPMRAGRSESGLQVYSVEMQAAQWLEKVAAQGYADAQYQLALLLSGSCGLIAACGSDNPAIVEREKQARQWWDRAIDQGYVPAIVAKADRLKETEKVEAARLYCNAMQQQYWNVYNADIDAARSPFEESQNKWMERQREEAFFNRISAKLQELKRYEPSAPWPECKVRKD
jgi:TPR repeat protein